jgi:hypothetical protein
VVQFADDAFYYFKIAQNIVNAHTVTFDGQSVTNGFHPLWLVVITPLFLISSDPVIMLSIVGSFSSTLLFAGYLAGALFIVHRFSFFASSICAVFAVYFAHVFSRCNLEISLLIPLAVAALLVLSQMDFTFSSRKNLLRASVLGWLLALMQLSRLDAVFLSVTIVALVSLRCLWSGKSRNAWIVVAVAGPSFVTGLVYLVVNYLWFGHIIPVSAMSKQMSGTGLNYVFLNQLFLARGWIVYSATLTLALFHLMVYVVRKQTFSFWTEGALNASIVVSIFMIMYTSYHLLRTSWFLWDWYLYPALLGIFFVLPFWLDIVRAKLETTWSGRCAFVVRWVPIVAFCLVGAETLRQAAWLFKNVEHSYVYQNYRIAGMLNEILEAGPRLGMGDRAGSLAYFYRGPVTQLEGLVGDYNLPRAIAANELGEYITARGVKFVVSWDGPNVPYEKWALTIPDPKLSLGPFSELQMCSSSEALRDLNPAGSVYVWKWPGCSP